LFFANYIYKPQVYKQLRKDETIVEQTTVHNSKLKDLYRQLVVDIEFRNIQIREYANKKYNIEPPLKKKNKVYLFRKNIKTKQLNTKLDFKKLGPFRVAERIGTINFRLELPENSKLHLVFHVALLELARGEILVITDAEIQLEHNPDIYKVKKILDTRQKEDN
jgi:hypothetical protein